MISFDAFWCRRGGKGKESIVYCNTVGWNQITIVTFEKNILNDFLSGQ